LPPLSSWFALAGSAALPAYTAYKYAQFAQSPGWYDDEWSFALVALFIAQIPVILLGAVFAGVSYIEGPAWRRVLVYVIVVAIVGAVSGMAKLALDSELGPILAWAVALQVVNLMFAGPQPALARARIDAATNDAVNLYILCVFGGAVAAVGALAIDQYTRNTAHAITFALSDLAWVGAVYFALRAWSGAYVHTAAFEARGKGYFQRPWIDWLTTKRGRPAE
jgi:hypothetical protein